MDDNSNNIKMNRSTITVFITIIMFFLLQTVGAVWWAATQTTRQDYVEKEIKLLAAEVRSISRVKNYTVEEATRAHNNLKEHIVLLKEQLLRMDLRICVLEQRSDMGKK